MLLAGDFIPFPLEATGWAQGDGSVRFVLGRKPLNPQPLPPGFHAHTI
jgi:hypothetical protein